MSELQAQRGRPSLEDLNPSIRDLIRHRYDPWLLERNRWARENFVAQIATSMFRNRTAGLGLAVRHVVRSVLAAIADDFGETTTTGRLARLLAETDLDQKEIAGQLGLSATWLSKEYIPRITALVLNALTRMAKDSDECPSQNGKGKAFVEFNAGSEGSLQRAPGSKRTQGT